MSPAEDLEGELENNSWQTYPSDRFQEEPPFTHCGVDMFGPFYIKQRQNTLKLYGVLFTCLVSRAVHIETTKTMDTDSFILAPRRFIARRGNVRSIRCDNGRGSRKGVGKIL